MKRKKFTEEQIIKVLKRLDAGEKLKEICRDVGVVEQTIYSWRQKYGDQGVSERRACRVIGRPPPTKRFEPKEAPLNQQIKGKLIELAAKKPRYGCPRLYLLLLREGFTINHERTERLYREEGLSLRKKSKKNHYKSKLRAPLVQPSNPDEIWAMDFVSDQLASGERFRSLTIIDIYTRLSPAIEGV